MVVIPSIMTFLLFCWLFGIEEEKTKVAKSLQNNDKYKNEENVNPNPSSEKTTKGQGTSKTVMG